MCQGQYEDARTLLWLFADSPGLPRWMLTTLWKSGWSQPHVSSGKSKLKACVSMLRWEWSGRTNWNASKSLALLDSGTHVEINGLRSLLCVFTLALPFVSNSGTSGIIRHDPRCWVTTTIFPVLCLRSISLLRMTYSRARILWRPQTGQWAPHEGKVSNELPDIVKDTGGRHHR